MLVKNKTSLLVKTLQYIMRKIYITFNNSNKENYKSYQAISKPVTHFLFPDHVKIICFADIHIGNKYCNPKYIPEIIKKEKPHGVFLLGDTFDAEEYHNSLFQQLNTQEKIVLEYLKNFHHQPEKTLGLIKGDHDNWLTQNNLIESKPISKALLQLGTTKIILTHGDDYDIHKQTDQKFLKIIIEPVFYLLIWLAKSLKNQTAQNIINWARNHPIFIKTIKISRYLAYNDAYAMGANAVVIGHFHTKKKYNGLRNKKIIRYRVLDGAIEKPRQYLIITVKRNKLSIRIKTFRQKHKKTESK